MQSISRRVDVMQKAIDDVQAWRDGATKQTALRILRRRMRQLHRQVPA